MYLVIVQLA